MHSAAELHGFLAYLMKCCINGTHYTVHGYKGKQVRDNIHAADLVGAFREFFLRPSGTGQVFNIGGGRQSNCSMLEAIDLCGEISGRDDYRGKWMQWFYDLHADLLAGDTGEFVNGFVGLTLLILSISNPEPARCQHCGSERLTRLMSRIATPKSEEARLESLADPWNPYIALPWALLLLAGVTQLANGQRRGWITVAVAGSIVAQLHAGFVPCCLTTSTDWLTAEHS